MKIFTNKAAAEALHIPISTWGWHKQRGTIPKGDLQVGQKWLYTEPQLEDIGFKLLLASYTKGRPGRKRTNN